MPRTTFAALKRQSLLLTVFLVAIILPLSSSIQNADAIGDVHVDFGPLVNLSNNPGPSYRPWIAVEGDDIYVVWAENTLLGFDEIYFKASHDRGETFEPTILIEDRGLGYIDPNIAVSGDHVYISWARLDENFDGFQQFMVSLDKGKTFEPAITIGEPGDASSYQKMVAAENNVYMVRNSRDRQGTFVGLRISHDYGSTFLPEFSLGRNPADSEGAPLVYASGQNLYMTWNNDNLGNHEVFFRVSHDGGATFEPTINLSANPQDSYSNQIIEVIGDHVTVAYFETLNSMVMRESDDNGATFGSKVPVNMLLRHPAASDGENLYITFGNGHGIWFDFSEDRGVTFGSRVNLDPTPSFSSVDARIAISGDGKRLYVFWADSGEIVIRVGDIKRGGSAIDSPPETSPVSASDLDDNPILDNTYTASQNVRFIFDGSDDKALAGFECRADDEPTFSECSSPKEYSDLAAGTHTFEVRAVDSAGNMDLTPSIFSWSVDPLPSETRITKAIDGSSNSIRNGGFTLSDTTIFNFKGIDKAGTVSGFECRLDDAPSFTPCSSPTTYTDLSPDSHVFRVRAVDGAGNVDPTPSVWRWWIPAVHNAIIGTDEHDYLSGESGIDIIKGLSGPDSIFGRAGDDRLEGGYGRDKLSGGMGDDLLIGGPGGDALTGGLGADSFDCGPGIDYILDFNEAEGDTKKDDCENTVVAPNLIGDPGFESGKVAVDAREPRGYWGSTSDRFDGFVGITEEEAHSGTNSLKISGDITDAAYVYQFVQPYTQDYTFSFWYKGTEGDTIGEVLTGWGPPPWFLGGPSGGTLGSSMSPTSVADSIFPLDGQWHQATVVNTNDVKAFYLDGEPIMCAAGDVVSPTVSIIGDVSTRASSGMFYIDDVSLVKGQQIPIACP